jgi:hypothetical protein
VFDGVSPLPATRCSLKKTGSFGVLLTPNPENSERYFLVGRWLIHLNCRICRFKTLTEFLEKKC